jgi:hypothetical protein
MTCTPSWTDQLTAIGTIAAVVVALALALWGSWLGQWFFHPKLKLEAKVKRPDADLVRRRASNGFQVIDLGWYYYFRVAITNTGNKPAREVQVFLSKVERVKGRKIENVKRFTPMNLLWTNTEDAPPAIKVTRPVLLADTPPVFCDLAHVGEPQHRKLSGEDLEDVPDGKAVLGLDVQVATYSKGHLLEPGTYLFYLTLAASNCRSTHHVVKVSFLGEWLPEKEMFESGFKMEKLR